MGFNQFVDTVIGFEGGFTDDSAIGDKGGPTKYGITQQDLKDYPGLMVKDLTIEQSRSIYFRDYWIKNHCETLPQDLQFAFFDCCVNQGPSRAKKLIQSAFGLKADGVFGPMTYKVFKDYEAYSAEVKKSVLISFLAGRMVEYGNLGIFKQFGRGWSKRLMTVAALSLQGMRS